MPVVRYQMILMTMVAFVLSSGVMYAQDSDVLKPGLEAMIATLKRATSDLESSIAADAEKLRQASPPDTATSDALTASVQKLFDLRQQLQSAEAERMRLKLHAIEANLAVRLQNRDRIVQWRVEELLDPNGTATGWNLSVQGTPRGDYGMPTTGTPIGLPGPPMLSGTDETNFDVGGLQSRQVQNISGPVKWKEPNEVVSELRMWRHQLEEFVGRRAVFTEEFANWSRPLDQFTEEQHKGMTEETRVRNLDEVKDTLSRNEKILIERLADWKLAWASCQTQLRLLKLDVDEATLAMESVQKNHDYHMKLVERGIATGVFEVDESRTQLAIARIQVQRAEELLRLYEEIEKTEPHLNPELFQK